MSKKEKILQPQYVQKFQCIGGACEDSCCEGWRVDVDKATYELYKKCPDAQLRQKLAKTITRNRVNPTNETYAKIKMAGVKDCPFLDEEKLCSLQRSMGEKYLSIICASYPRRYNTVNGVLEKSLGLSCPEAARLALLNTSPMEFEMAEEDAHIRKSIDQILDTDDAKKKHKPEQYFPELRFFTIALLQNRLYPLWQRLVILGLFCNNLNNLIAEKKNNEILPLIKAYLEHLQEGVFHDSLESIPNKLSVQIEIIRKLAVSKTVDTKLKLKVINERFFECFVKAMMGINYSAKLPQEEISAQYALVYKDYYQPFASKYEYILENYLANYVFAMLFPFTGKNSVFDNYIMLIVHYAIVKMLIIGMSGFYKEEFNISHMLKLIQSLSKVATHDSMYLKSIADLLKSNNMDNMPYMSILIKN